MLEKKPIFKLIQVVKTKASFKNKDSIKYIFDEEKIETGSEYTVSSRKINNNNLYDVTLETTLTSRSVETKDTIYEINVGFCGIFEIKNMSEKDVDKVKRTHALFMLYPYCRAAISQILSDTAFPVITIDSIDFFDVYNSIKK